jgi:hypothetical protein
MKRLATTTWWQDAPLTNPTIAGNNQYLQTLVELLLISQYLY